MTHDLKATSVNIFTEQVALYNSVGTADNSAITADSSVITADNRVITAEQSSVQTLIDLPLS